MFKFLKDRKKDNKGFTLVELVIVVAILAILVGLLAPQYTKYVERSRKAADVSNMDEMIKAIQVYAADGDANLAAITTAETIVLDPDNEPTVGIHLKPALEAYCPEYIKIRQKSKKWASAPTASITVDAEGNVTVTYGPDVFANYIGKKATH